MNSLRWRLLFIIWAALLVVGAGLSAIAYWQQRAETDALFDYQIEQIAGLVAASSLGSSGAATITPQIALDHDPEDDLELTLRTRDGHVVYSSLQQSPLPAVEWTGFRTVDFNHESYRLYSGWSNDHQILVAQQIEPRLEAGRDAAWIAAIPLLVMIPVLGVIIWIVVRQQLRPLRVAVDEISQRPLLALSPLSTQGLPAEVQPLLEEINRLLQRLGRAVDYEKRFVADAAHALRTPLAALQLQVDVLDGVSDPDERANRLADLRGGIRRTARLTERLLTLARTESGAPLDLRQTDDVDLALKEIAEHYQPLADARNVQLMVDTYAVCSIRLTGEDLVVVIGNLLDNALKHSPSGGLVILRARSDHEHRVTIEVIDQGTGIPDADLGRVVERFHRASGDKTEGSGLGLAIVKTLVENANGCLVLENRSDQLGLCARLVFPGKPIQTTIRSLA